MENKSKAQEQFATLIYKHIMGNLSEHEKDMLNDLLATSADTKAFFDEIADLEKIIQEIGERHRIIKMIDREAAWRRFVEEKKCRIHSIAY